MISSIFIGIDFGIRHIGITSSAWWFFKNQHLKTGSHRISEITLKNNDETKVASLIIIKKIKELMFGVDKIYIILENIDTFESGIGAPNKFKIPTIKLFQSLIENLELLIKNNYNIKYTTFNSNVIKMLQKRVYFKRLFEVIKKENNLKTLSSHAKDSFILCYLGWTKVYATLFKYEQIK